MTREHDELRKKIRVALTREREELRKKREELHKKIEATLSVFDPPPSAHERAKYRNHIKSALISVDFRSGVATAHKIIYSKDGKAGVQRFRKALLEVNAAYNALDPSIRPWFSLAEMAHVAGAPTIIDRELQKVTSFIKPSPLPKPKRSAVRNKVAVEAAYRVLNWLGRKTVAARDSEWDQLAMKFADSKTSLYNHLYTFKIAKRA